jgi:very-short-patch-repair endonuclease
MPAVEAVERCDRLAANQHGVLSREQALVAGLSNGAISRRVTSGRWRVLHAGVYALRAVPTSWEQRLMAAILCGGPTALASHRSAAAIRRLDGVDERPVEISIKTGRRIRGTIVHRRRPTDDPAVEVLGGIPVTGVERTLLDLAAVVTPQRAGLALDDALRRDLTTLDALRVALPTRRGRAGSAILRQLLDARDERDAVLESRLESSLLRLLRDHHLPLPIPQHRVTLAGELVARLDFAYPSHRLAIEADGYRWHGGRERWRKDVRRENRLKLMGWTLLRFSWEDVHDQPEAVAGSIRAALGVTDQGSLDNSLFR